MTKFLLRALLLAFVSWGAQAAAPSATCTPSRTSGTEPLFVNFDCSGTTDADTSKPFHDLFYEHTFGDRSAGTWSYGANANQSKNYATGPIAGHVFETCVGSPFTTTHQVSDGTNLIRVTNTITVACADTTYSTTNTHCFTNGSDFTGCPTGATQHSSSSDYDAAIASLNTGKRVLLRRGDTFTANVNSPFNVAGPMTIGAYGSGAKPIINLVGAIHVIEGDGTTLSDLRMMDLDIRGESADKSQTAFTSSPAINTITLLRLTVSGTGSSAVSFGGGCTGCVIQDGIFSAHYNGYLLYGLFYNSAVLGNSVGPGGGGSYEGAFRAYLAQKSVFSNNTLTQAGTTVNKPVMRISAPPHVTTADDSFYVIAADNNIQQGLSGAFVFTHQGNLGGDERNYDFIVERNWIKFGPIGSSGFDCHLLKTNGTRITVRNNVFDMSNDCGDDMRGVNVVRDDAAAPNPTDVNIYNNTVYAAGSQPYRGVVLNANTTNAIVKNNLCRADFGTGGTACVSDGGTGTTNPTQPTAGGNSSTAQMTGTDPSFDGPLTSPIGFRIGTGSYASNVGVAIFPASNDDFFHCDDNTSNERIGAFVPRARARCRGAAGP